ncbi:MAG: hypothetical protein EZS28_047741 [Streblomastix strix]|uniref:Uncharacterized protein n=1 Tax=Streblomastix strix TaxID=222440 RepID=A0A5J4TFU8_9EUKA|nr:MAG: hypothetical protein EZS28_047741 [Streblomastix strix]
MLDVLNKCLQENIDPQKLAIFAPTLNVLKQKALKQQREEGQLSPEEVEQQQKLLQEYARDQAKREGRGAERAREILQEENLAGIITRVSMILAYLKEQGIQ